MTTQPAAPPSGMPASTLIAPAPRRGLARMLVSRILGERLGTGIVSVLAGAIGVGLGFGVVSTLTGGDLGYSAALAFAPTVVLCAELGLTLVVGGGSLRMSLAAGVTRAAFLRAWFTLLAIVAMPLGLAFWSGSVVLVAADHPGDLALSLAASVLAALTGWFLGLGLNLATTVTTRVARIGAILGLLLLAVTAMTAGGVVLPDASTTPALGWALLSAAAALAIASTTALVLRAAAPADLMSTLTTREKK